MSGAATDRAALAESWRAFCRRLEAMGNLVLEADVADTPIDQAEGYRYLTRLLRIALNVLKDYAFSRMPLA